MTIVPRPPLNDWGIISNLSSRLISKIKKKKELQNLSIVAQLSLLKRLLREKYCGPQQSIYVAMATSQVVDSNSFRLRRDVAS